MTRLQTQPATRATASSLLPVLGLPYHRVSSDEQERDGVSLPAQHAQTKGYIAGLGWQIGSPYVDVLTGKRDDRRDYQRLLADIRRYRQEGRRVAVVVSRLDRLGRRMLERVRSREEFKLLGVPTHSVREGGEVSDLTANVLAAVAQEEVERLAGRVSDAIQFTRANGFAGGTRLPWGYTWRPATEAERRAGSFRIVLDAHPEEAPHTSEAFARAASGESVHAVARWASHLPSEARGGRTLSYPTVLRLLKNPIYIARQPLDRSEHAQGHRLSSADIGAILASPAQRWPALVDDQTWATVQARIAGHARVPRQGGRGDYLLTGLVYCPVCGARMSGGSAAIKKTAPDGTVRRYAARRYRCSASKRGATAQQTCRYEVHAPSLEADARRRVSAVLDAFLGDARNRRDTRAAYEALRRPQTRAGAEQAKKLVGIEGAVQRANTTMLGATQKYVDGKISEAQYLALTAKLEGDLRRLEAERVALVADQQAQGALPDLPEWDALLAEATDWRRITGNAQDAQTGDPQALRGVLVALIDRLEPRKAGYARAEASITWTSKGQALAVAAGLAGAAERGVR